MYRFFILISTAFLAACMPPSPPVVSGYNRQPINNHEKIEILNLKAELAQAKEQLSIVTKPDPLKLTVYFPSNNVNFNPTPSQKAYLFSILKDAQYIIIKGRTDGQKYSRGDERVALNRALSAKRFLVNNGISPQIITINHISGSDYVADNSSEEGRAKNRRVDIEVYPKQTS